MLQIDDIFPCQRITNDFEAGIKGEIGGASFCARFVHTSKIAFANGLIMITKLHKADGRQGRALKDKRWRP